MVYHITKITNNSSKSVVLINPVAQRDRHLVVANSSVVPPYPPKVEYIKEDNIPFETAIKKALSIYTTADNWCFWDDGSTDHLVGLGEGGGDKPLFIQPNATKLELIIDKNGAPGFVHSKVSLPLKMQSQLKDGLRLNWCWAAATVSIANYYLKADTWEQCGLANLAFDRKDCCSWPKCDRGWQANDALEITGNLESGIEGQITFEKVMEQIDANLAISIGLAGSIIGHNVVIAGYNRHDPQNPTVRILNPDPLYAESEWDFAAFCKSYGRYTWKQTYLTKRQG